MIDLIWSKVQNKLCVGTGPYKNTNQVVTKPKQLQIKTYFFDSILA